MKTHITNRKPIAEGTMAFLLEKPEGFEYKAGQNSDFTLINPSETDEEGNSRTFSLASAPHEKELMFATRLRDSAFKRIIKSANLPLEIDVTEAIGSFTLQSNTERPAIFLIGGIGITPVRSIILDATERSLPHRIYLFFSNRRPEDAPFFQDLEEAQKKNPNFHFIATMTKAEESKQQWSGETGYIDEKLIEKHAPDDFRNAIWYLTGPAAMVKAMQELLGKMSIDPDNVKTEEFTGY